MENIHNDHTLISLDTFTEIIATLPKEDIEEIFLALTNRKENTVEDGKYTVNMLQMLWHYR